MNLFEIYQSFKTENDCQEYLIQLRWPNGIECIFCKSDKIYRRSYGSRLKCRCCNKSFSVTAKTIFHSTKLPLSKWFFAAVQILSAKKGISSLQLARTINVNKNTAWYMQMRIRAAMKTDLLLRGLIEVEEGLIIGEVRLKNPAMRDKKINEYIKSIAYEDTNNQLRQTERFIKLNHKRNPQISQNNLTIKYTDCKYPKIWIGTYFSMFKRALIGQYHQLSERHMIKYIEEMNFKRSFNDIKSFDVLLLKACAVCWEMGPVRKLARE